MIVTILAPLIVVVPQVGWQHRHGGDRQ